MTEKYTFFTVSDLSAGYGKNTILKEISFDVTEGSLVGILGANGSGKSTLLKAICGIIPHKGKCRIENKEESVVLEDLNTRQLARRCAYIPQRSGISIDLSVMDVVLMGFNPRLKLLEHPTKAMKEQAAVALEKVGLKGKEEMNYLHLSEGQKQLCIFARTMISDCQLLLLDEPESALDFRFRYQSLDILKKWIQEERRGGIVALHDPMLAFQFCDRLLLLNDGNVYGSIVPDMDAIEEMEEKLRTIYGQISLQRCKSRSGKIQLVMLKET